MEGLLPSQILIKPKSVLPNSFIYPKSFECE